MNIHSKDVSDEQFQKLMKEHQQQQAKLAQGFDTERERQKQLLKQKVKVYEVK